MMMKELLNKDEQGNVLSYNIYKTNFDKKEGLVNLKADSFSIFKCVASHKDFATLVQNVVISRELTDLNSQIKKLEDRQIQEFELSEKDENKLEELRRRKELAEKFIESLTPEIPQAYVSKKFVDYPQTALLLSNWIDGNIPKFPINPLKACATKAFGQLVESGKTDLSDDFCKEVKTLLEGFYKETYSTKKDSIFKKWILKFDLKGIRQMLLACGFDPTKANGNFEYSSKSDEEIQKVVAHALMRRMQKDSAEVDKPKPSNSKTTATK